MQFDKILYLAPFLLISSYAAGQDTLDSKCQPLTPGYNASCRIETQGCIDAFVWGSFIYYQPIQENMELGVVSDTKNALDLVNGYVIDLDVDYKPGFKVGIGMNFSCDEWTSYLQYTWFRGTNRTTKSLDPNNAQIALLPAWEIPNFLAPQYNYGSEKWKLEMDLVDWNLARSYHVGQKLCFQSYVGLRFARIDQDLDVDYVNTDPANFFIWPSTSIDQSSCSWGIGPQIGLNTNWSFCNGFRFYSIGEMDVLFTQYDLKSTQTTEVTTANQIIVNYNDANFLRLHTELALGLGWGCYFCCDSYHFDLSADYGFQVFFDQNMLRVPVSAQAIGKSTLPNGNLYLHGLTVTARFDF